MTDKTIAEFNVVIPGWVLHLMQDAQDLTLTHPKVAGHLNYAVGQIEALLEFRDRHRDEH